MANGIDNNEVATLSLLGGANGTGVLGNNILRDSALADGTAMKEAIDCNSTRFTDGLNTLSSQFSNINNANRFDRVNENLSDAEFRSDSKFSTLNKNISDSEFRTIDRNRDIEGLVIDGQKEQASCCCETQKQMAAGFASIQLEASKNQSALLLKMCEDKNEIENKMRDGFDAIATREHNAALSRITQLETINAINGYTRP